MSNELYDELIAKGYLPELKFRNDAYTKLLYVKNLNEDSVRVSNVGNFNVPTFPILNQNQTLKSIQGGTRVHLGPTDEDPGEGPWSCTGNVTNTITLKSDYSSTTRYFRITVSHPNDSRTYECSGSGYLGAVLLSNSSFATYLDSCNIQLNWDSGEGNYFYNQDADTDYQIEILEVTAAGVPRESDIYWPEQENTSFVYVPNYALRFCLAHKQQVLPVISCADASTNISFRFNIFNIDEFFVDGVSYGYDWSLMWRDDYLKTIFNADYDNTGYVRNESAEPHRILIMGSDLNFEDIGDPNLSLTYDEDGEWVGFCLAEQQIIVPDIVAFALEDFGFPTYNVGTTPNTFQDWIDNIEIKNLDTGWTNENFIYDQTRAITQFGGIQEVIDGQGQPEIGFLGAYGYRYPDMQNNTGEAYIGGFLHFVNFTDTQARVAIKFPPATSENKPSGIGLVDDYRFWTAPEFSGLNLLNDTFEYDQTDGYWKGYLAPMQRPDIQFDNFTAQPNMQLKYDYTISGITQYSKLKDYESYLASGLAYYNPDRGTKVAAYLGFGNLPDIQDNFFETNYGTDAFNVTNLSDPVDDYDTGFKAHLYINYMGYWVYRERIDSAQDLTWDFEYKLSTASTPTKIKLGSATSGVNITNTVTTNIDKATIEWVHVNSTVSNIGSGTFRVGIPPSVATELVLPTSLRTIGSECFEHWTACTELTIPEGVANIGQYAFRGWSSVLHVTIPSTLNVMQTRAFAGWSSCLTITCTALQPPTYSAFDTDPFQGLNAAARIYVPADSVTAYKVALGWSRYASIILPIT